VAHDAAIVARQHTQNGMQAPPNVQRVADHGGVRVQAFSPETIAYDRHRLTLIGCHIQPPDRTADAEHIEEIRAGSYLPNSFVARIRPPTGISQPGIECQVLKDSCMSQVAVFTGGYCSAESYQPVRLPGAQVVQKSSLWRRCRWSRWSQCPTLEKQPQRKRAWASYGRLRRA